MKEELKFICLTESNSSQWLEKISALHAQVNGKIREPSYWESRYLKGLAGNSRLILAIQGGRIIGKYGLIYLPLMLRGERIKAGLMGDLSVLPSQRSWQCYLGLVEANIEYSRSDEPAFRFGVAHPSMLKLNNRMGITCMGKIPVYAAVINIRNVFREYSILRPFSAAGYLFKPFLKKYFVKGQTDTADIRPIERFNADFDRIWEPAAVSKAIAVIKDSSYLNWHYCDCPGYRYAILALYRNGSPEGIIVYRKMDNSSCAFLLELLARNDDISVMRSLLFEAAQRTKKDGAGQIKASFGGSSIQASVLSSAGFRLSKVGRRHENLIAAESYPGRSLPDLVMKDWCFSMGDWIVY